MISENIDYEVIFILGGIMPSGSEDKEVVDTDLIIRKSAQCFVINGENCYLCLIYGNSCFHPSVILMHC